MMTTHTTTDTANGTTAGTKRTLYWIATGLVTVAFTAMGASNLLRASAMMEGLAHLGYPPYLATILGTWKLLAAVALVAPGRPLLKEWAYAGMFFVLTGAAMSHAAVGDPVGHILAPLVVLALVATSWALRAS